MKAYVNYFPQFHGFGIADSEWQKVSDQSVVTMFLSDEDYGKFAGKVPSDDAPVIGIMCGRKYDHYIADADCVRAIVATGARIQFLDYYNYMFQMQFCDALVLHSESFVAPEKYYTDPKQDLLSSNRKCMAFEGALKIALDQHIPVLGINAGMQIMAAEFGLKLYRMQRVGAHRYFESPYSHHSKDVMAHHVDVVEGTPFFDLIGKKRIEVNSRHHKVVAPERVQRELLGEGTKPVLDFYAFATDGIPEALGLMKKGLLGVQWQPEKFAVRGDEIQQRIFSWLFEKATENLSL